MTNPSIPKGWIMVKWNKYAENYCNTSDFNICDKIRDYYVRIGVFDFH